MPKPVLGPRNRTNPLIWCAAIICAILTVVVIFVGLIIFIGYLTIKPKVPQVSVAAAQFDTIYFDQANLLTVQITIVIRAENGNTRARAYFYDTRYVLSYRGQRIAYLWATEPYSVNANSSLELNFVSQSTPIPLNPGDSEAVNAALRAGVVVFELKGTTRTRWRVGLIGSVKFWLHLDCQLHLPVDGSRSFPRCSSRNG